MATVSMVSIPTELICRDQWVLWRLEQRHGKWTKVPYQARRPRICADSTDPTTWSSFARALGVAHQADGIGFVVTSGDPFLGIDLDGCRDRETGQLEAWAQSLVRRFDSYSEVTVSQSGIRIWIKAELPGQRHRKDQVELYDERRFFTVTGAHLDDTPADIQDRQSVLEDFYKELFGQEELPRERREPHQPIDLSDAAILDLARNARNGGKFWSLWNGEWKTLGYRSRSNADAALCGMLAFYTQRDAARMDRLFRLSGLMRDKWDQRRGNRTYGGRTIDFAIAKCPDVYEKSALATLIIGPITRGQRHSLDPAPPVWARQRSTFAPTSPQWHQGRW